MALGVVIFLGSLIKTLEFTAMLVSAIGYLSYGLSRLISLYLDGMPSENWVMATAIECVIGMACLMLLYSRKAQTIAYS